MVRKPKIAFSSPELLEVEGLDWIFVVLRKAYELLGMFSGSQSDLTPPIDRSRRVLLIGGLRLAWEGREHGF